MSSGGFRAALKHRDFRFLMAAVALAYPGMWAYNVVLGVWIFDQTHSPTWVSAIAVIRFVPSMLFGPYAGVLAERFDRIGLMRRLDTGCALGVVGIGVVVMLDGPVVVALAGALVVTLLGTAYGPAAAATAPAVVGEADLAAANALDSLVMNLSALVGPALVGVMLVWLQPDAVLFATAATYFWSAFMVGRIRTRPPQSDVTEGGTSGPWQQIAVGFRAISGSATALVLVAFGVLGAFVYGSDTVLLLVLSQDRLGTGADGYSYLVTGIGVGGILAALLVDRLAAAPRLGLVLMVGMALYCLPTLALISVHQPQVAVALQAVRGVGAVLVEVITMTAVQRALAPDLVARVFGIFFAAQLGAIAIGALLTPQVLRFGSLDVALVVFGAGVPLVVLLGLPQVLRMDRTAVLRLAELAPRIAVLESLGIFARAGRPALERLAVSCEPVPIGAGEAIVRQGEEADALYIVVSGEVEVTSHGEGLTEEFLRTMGPGTYFGEIGILAGLPRTATVVATEPTQLWRIGADDFREALATGHASSTMLDQARNRLRLTHRSLRPDELITDEP